MKKACIIFACLVVVFFCGLGLRMVCHSILRSSQTGFAEGVMMDAAMFCIDHQRLPNNYEELNDWKYTQYKNRWDLQSAEHVLVFKWGTPITDLSASSAPIAVTSPLIKQMEGALNKTFLSLIKGGDSYDFRYRPQFSKNATAAQTPAQIALGSSLSEAISLATQYLERACDSGGKFAYLVDLKSNSTKHKYNVVRHEGAMYALTMCNGFNLDRNAADALARSGNFLRQKYIAPVPGSTAEKPVMAVWSSPVGTKDAPKAALGGAGLGLVALGGLKQVQPESVSVDELRALGRFLLFLQKEDGSFRINYVAQEEQEEESTATQSLYFPGEAALGLLSLYEADPSKEWLDAAEKALLYLAKNREPGKDIPPDCWGLIATAKLIAIQDRNGIPDLSRGILVRHAAQICEGILAEQISHAPQADLNGGFDPTGRTTPTATRLEGLLSALEFLPKEKSDLRSRIDKALPPAIAFLLQAQVRTGPYAGGFRGAVDEVERDPATGHTSLDHRASEIRIDYVQHAVCALIHYERLFHPEASESERIEGIEVKHYFLTFRERIEGIEVKHYFLTFSIDADRGSR